MRDLRGEVVVVTGAGSGIGKAQGVPEAEACDKTRAFYEAMLGWINDHLERYDDGGSGKHEC